MENDEQLFRTVVAGSGLLVLALASASLLLATTATAGGIVVGGMLAIVNFCWLRLALVKLLATPDRSSIRRTKLRALLRLAIMGLALYLVLTRLAVDIIGLLIGLSAVMITILLATGYSLVTGKGA